MIVGVVRPEANALHRVKRAGLGSTPSTSVLKVAFHRRALRKLGESPFETEVLRSRSDMVEMMWSKP